MIRNNEYRAYTPEPERDGTMSSSMEKLVLETCPWAENLSKSKGWG